MSRRRVSTLLVIAHNPGLTNLMNHLLGSHRNAIEHLPTFGCAHFTLSGRCRNSRPATRV